MMEEHWNVDPWVFRRGARIYPQPVAIACGRVHRSRDLKERLDTVLRCSETLVRYLAAISLSSLAAREEGAAGLKAPSLLKGNLSFGSFLTIVQQAAGLPGHPLHSHLSPFRSSKKNPEGKANDALVRLLEIRNNRSHDLQSLSDPLCLAVMQGLQPDTALESALKALESVLNLPLFVVEEVTLEIDEIRARRLLLMGESADPNPEVLRLSAGVHCYQPHLAVGPAVLQLPPALIWELILSRQNYQMALLHSVDAEMGLTLRTLDGDPVSRGPEDSRLLCELATGGRRAAAIVTLVDGTDLVREWVPRKKAEEEAIRTARGLVPWDDLDPESMSWYAARLSEDPAPRPREAILSQLLLGRSDGFKPDEIRQLLLLFGKQEAVGRVLQGRDMVDLRQRTPDTEGRWDERVTGHHNIVHSLRTAVDFLARHVKFGENRDLRQTTGTPDYIALREALVNQFIHQDYTDTRAAAQIELSPDKALFFNPGQSLVDEPSLLEGGRSQSRNPLVARALRLLGFAELAGSGIREMQRVWRKARRRPPRFESNEGANTFTLTLDWRSVPEAYDQVWKSRIGVQLTEHQATVLNLTLDPAGITVAEAASATGLPLDEARAVLAFLARQVLVRESEGRHFLQDHLRELAR